MKGKNPFEVNPYSTKWGVGEAEQLYKDLVAEANRRMQELENSRSPITGKPYTGWAYKHYGLSVLEGETRWKEEPPSDRMAMYRKIVQVQAFLKAKSSTVEGAKETESKTLSTFRQGKAGGVPTKFTGDPSALWDLFESGLVKAFEDAGLGSPITVEMTVSALNEGQNISDIKGSMLELLDDFSSKSKTPSIKAVEEALGVKWLE